MAEPPDKESERKETALDASIGPIRQFGRYTLFKKLATGGMAEIWLARQSGVAGFNRFVVIKKILSHLAEEETFRNMFLDEARMSAMLTHPNIVQVYDLGEADETYFIAMEFILGENLAAIAWRAVKRQSPLSPTFAARIIADASKALDYAHRLKGPNGVGLEIVHRDISPQNILVTYEGEVKVVDFGIAKAASKSQHTKTGMLKGKFSYMSPEQCQGFDVDRRSDVFALGIVLYELCTGKRLFKHESELMILEMITKRRITPPSEVADNIAPELEAIIMRALEKDTSVRFQSGQELQIALEDFIRNQTEGATSADLAAYMRSLFQDKMDEKRRLQEAGSKEDFGGNATFADEQPTQNAQPQYRGGATNQQRGMVIGASPSQVRYQQQTQAGAGPMMPMQQFQDPAMGQHMSFARVGTQQQPLTDEGAGWVPKVIIGLASLVIFVAAAYLWWILNPTAPPAQRMVGSGVSEQLGDIAVDSVPDGATIAVDGVPVKLTDGNLARTPIPQLTNLQYGKTYKITLEKDGYDVYVENVTMGPNMRSIRPALTPISGRVVVEVPDGFDVVVFLNRQRAGVGTIEQRVPPGRLIITAEKPRSTCKATPEEVTVSPGGSVRSTVRCTAGGGTPIRINPPPGDGTNPTPTRQPAPTAAPVAGGCVPLPGDVSPGFVTIDTTPSSEIFWDGKRLGETPVSRQKLPAGCIELVAKTSDKEMKVKVMVEPNKVQRYKFDIK